ncbi:MAG: hypothetical protein V7L31_08695 [Nostoc sp.]|uniref:hypothetical protein n=1 Tax=Nostoc sp. TaxID=1180 RepID=UPI002FF3B110
MDLNKNEKKELLPLIEAPNVPIKGKEERTCSEARIIVDISLEIDHDNTGVNVKIFKPDDSKPEEFPVAFHNPLYKEYDNPKLGLFKLEIDSDKANIVSIKGSNWIKPPA